MGGRDTGGPYLIVSVVSVGMWGVEYEFQKLGLCVNVDALQLPSMVVAALVAVEGNAAESAPGCAVQVARVGWQCAHRQFDS